MAKTTFRVNKQRWELFNRECKASFLRRDAYLNHILPEEVSILEQLPPNNEEAHQWLKNTWFGEHGQLRADTTDFVSVMLDNPLLKNLNQSCVARNIPRDAFFHCVLMFITERLYEAALVIKNPRTKQDTFLGVAQACNAAQDDEDEELDEEQIREDMKFSLLEIGLSTRNRNLEPLRSNYYETELSLPPWKLAVAKNVAELFKI